MFFRNDDEADINDSSDPNEEEESSVADSNRFKKSTVGENIEISEGDDASKLLILTHTIVIPSRIKRRFKNTSTNRSKNAALFRRFNETSESNDESKNEDTSRKNISIFVNVNLNSNESWYRHRRHRCQ